MSARDVFRSVNPYLGGTVVVLLLGALLGTMYFTWVDLPWTAFLGGVLLAGVLALVGRASRAERIVTLRNEQLRSLRDRVAAEEALRMRLEHDLAHAREEVRRLRERPAAEPVKAASPASVSASAPGIRAEAADPHHPGHETYVDSLAESLTGWTHVGDRLVSAFEQNEFCLYAQAIRPLSPAVSGRFMHEILVRLNEEEENLMPPGAFFPLIERHGMMPRLDRWVVTHVLDWIAEAPERREVVYTVNVSTQTLDDADFGPFILGALRQRGLPGAVLCFELDSHSFDKNVALTTLVPALRSGGCRTALTQVGRGDGSFRQLRLFTPDYLKIDGSIVLHLLRDRVAAAKVKAIVQVAKNIGARTIAELVEDEETIAALHAAGVDFAQGFAISRPRPLQQLADARNGIGANQERAVR